MSKFMLVNYQAVNSDVMHTTSMLLRLDEEPDLIHKSKEFAEFLVDTFETGNLIPPELRGKLGPSDINAPIKSQDIQYGMFFSLKRKNLATPMKDLPAYGKAYVKIINSFDLSIVRPNYQAACFFIGQSALWYKDEYLELEGLEEEEDV